MVFQTDHGKAVLTRPCKPLLLQHNLKSIETFYTHFTTSGDKDTLILISVEIHGTFSRVLVYMDMYDLKLMSNFIIMTLKSLLVTHKKSFEYAKSTSRVLLTNLY